MKKIFLALLMVGILFMSSTSEAAWTLVVSKDSTAKSYVRWKVVCTSDGNALTATDLVALMDADLKRSVQGAMLTTMKVSPGTTTVAPDTTIDVTLGDAQGSTIFTHSAYSNTADTASISLIPSGGFPHTVSTLFYLTISDIGSSGDQVTLYFDSIMP